MCGETGRVGVPQIQTPINRVPLNGHDSRRTKVKSAGREEGGRQAEKRILFSIRYFAHLVLGLICTCIITLFQPVMDECLRTKCFLVLL